MNKKKKMILTVLLVAVVGFVLTPASATANVTQKSVNNPGGAIYWTDGFVYPSNSDGAIYCKDYVHKSNKLYFKKNVVTKCYSFKKKIDQDNTIIGVYTPKKVSGQNLPNTVQIGILGKDLGKANYKIVKTVIKFKKTVHGKTYYVTKTFKGENVYYKPANNYKPSCCIVYYVFSGLW